ncbi:hypothetical protein AN958_11367 [Leucoagaricus sp. SymC.cos]|nr:hypothetical protein AN958_11367 [Leucoagaricus sp. SymC.cos]
MANIIRDKFCEENAKLKRMLAEMEIERDELLCEKIDLRAEVERMQDVIHELERLQRDDMNARATEESDVEENQPSPPRYVDHAPASPDRLLTPASDCFHKDQPEITQGDIEMSDVLRAKSPDQPEELLTEQQDAEMMTVTENIEKEPSPAPSDKVLVPLRRGVMVPAPKEVAVNMGPFSVEYFLKKMEINRLRELWNTSLSKNPHSQVGGSSGTGENTLASETQDGPNTAPSLYDIMTSLSRMDVLPRIDEKRAFKLNSETVQELTSGFGSLKVERPFEKSLPRSVLTAFSRASNGDSYIGHLKFFFAPTDVNPYIPHSAGVPGLLLSCETEMTEGTSTWTLFIKKMKLHYIQWMYAGEYECQVVQHLEGKLFKAQTEKVKENWAKKILNNKKSSIYLRIKARIELRKEGKLNLPFGQQIIDAKVKEMRGRRQEILTTADIISAYENEEEVSGVLSESKHSLIDSLAHLCDWNEMRGVRYYTRQRP